jgi:hypothetical protein
VNIGYTNTAMWLVFSCIWLPFMIVPVYGAFERIPDSLIEASADLGARSWRTVRSVLLPLARPWLRLRVRRLAGRPGAGRDGDAHEGRLDGAGERSGPGPGSGSSCYWMSVRGGSMFIR